MKKLLVLIVALALVSIAAPVRAEGDFEMSGHINTGFGFQYRSAALGAAAGGAFTQEGMIPLNTTRYSAAQPKAFKLSHQYDVLAYVGEVELDITKTFGENIRLRADLDFGRMNSNGYYGNSLGGGLADDMIEQAYATVNIPVGNGMEFLIGRFNAPMGFEAVDNNDNDLPFHTVIFNFLRPQNLTGLKFYYPFSDLVDLHVWLANNLMDVQKGAIGGGYTNRPIPAVGMRLGFTWGEEGQESTVGISAAASPEARLDGYKTSGNWSYLADLDFNVWVNDVFAIGGEGLYRTDDASKAAKVGGGKNNTYYSAMLNLHYVFSDVWDGTLRYTWAFDKNGLGGTGVASLNNATGVNQFHRFTGLSALGAKMQNHQIDLGINYHITDGAKIMMMYRFDYIIPARMSVLGSRSYVIGNKIAMDHTLAANFAYEF